jgi:NAD(P)-dependent dehydrogenase (short-subunit alcohol dehydrogenase family)
MGERRAVVTGASGGVGGALAAALASRGIAVLALGRDAARLAECEAANPALITGLAVDLTAPEGVTRVRERVVASGGLSLLVHSAAVIDPIAPLAELDREAFRNAYAINVEAPLFLTQALLGSLSSGARILHLSSGAAHMPLAGCLAYCSTKAAFHMIYRGLQVELATQGVIVGSASPGSVDTEMQATLRNAGPRALADVEYFREIERRGALVTPARAGRFLSWLLLDCDAERFARRDWSISDTELQPDWDAP